MIKINEDYLDLIPVHLGSSKIPGGFWRDFRGNLGGFLWILEGSTSKINEDYPNLISVNLRSSKIPMGFLRDFRGILKDS